MANKKPFNDSLVVLARLNKLVKCLQCDPRMLHCVVER